MDNTNDTLGTFDYLLLLIVIAAVGYGLQLLLPIFTALHMPLIAVVVLLIGFIGYLANPRRFIRVIRTTGLFVIAMTLLRYGIGIYFHGKYDVLAAKAGSAATLVFLYQRINDDEPN